MRRSQTHNLNVSANGMSFVELLATLAILSLVATMAIGVAGPMAAGQRQAAAINAVEQAFERARLIASARSGATLSVRGDQFLITAASSIQQSEIQTAIVQLPSNWVAQLRVNGEKADEFRFDAAGRSVDATVFIRFQGAALPAATIEILGVTGQTRLVQESTMESIP